MNSHFLLEKLENSDEFKKFIEENKDAYLCSGFFMIDLENEKNLEDKSHFDFYIPSTKKTFSFELEQGVKMVELERFGDKIMEKVSMKNNFNLDEIHQMILNEMAEKKINNKILKLIFSLQNFENKDLLFGTILLSGLALIKMTFDISENKIIEFEKKSFFDMVKIVKK